MRILSLTELSNVQAAAGVGLPYILNEAIDYAALGVLVNIVYCGVTATAIGNGLLMGAGVGATYALVRSVIYI